MGQVKSEKGKASTIATGIVSASNSITTAGTVTRDKTSYYTANTVGRRLIINEDSIAKNIQSKIIHNRDVMSDLGDQCQVVRNEDHGKAELGLKIVEQLDDLQIGRASCRERV